MRLNEKSLEKRISKSSNITNFIKRLTRYATGIKDHRKVAYYLTNELTMTLICGILSLLSIFIVVYEVKKYIE